MQGDSSSGRLPSLWSDDSTSTRTRSRKKKEDVSGRDHHAHRYCCTSHKATHSNKLGYPSNKASLAVAVVSDLCLAIPKLYHRDLCLLNRLRTRTWFLTDGWRLRGCSTLSYRFVRALHNLAHCASALLHSRRFKLLSCLQDSTFIV